MILLALGLLVLLFCVGLLFLKRPVRLPVLAALAIAFLVWALRPTTEYLLRPKAKILLDQLAGRGCQYQQRYVDPLIEHHSLNPFAELVIRNPDFYCPIWAAEELELLRGLSLAERPQILTALDKALQRKPELFDTGDGVIRYGQPLRKARKTLQVYKP